MTPLPPGKKRRYKSLTVDRIDLVDRGANFDRASGDGSHIMLVKRDNSAPITQEPPIMAEPTAAEVTKRIADLEALVAKQATDNAAAVAKAVADATAAAEAKAAVEKAAADARATALEADVAKAKADAAVEVEKREIAAAVTKASELSLVLKADTDGPLLYRISKSVVAEDKARLDEILLSANEAIRVGKLFAEAGRAPAARADAGGNPEQVLYAKAEELRKADTKLSENDSIVKARELYPDLRRSYDDWKSAQINPTAARA